MATLATDIAIKYVRPRPCSICNTPCFGIRLNLDDRPGIDAICAPCFDWWWRWAESRGW